MEQTKALGYHQKLLLQAIDREGQVTVRSLLRQGYTKSEERTLNTTAHLLERRGLVVLSKSGRCLIATRPQPVEVVTVTPG